MRSDGAQIWYGVVDEDCPFHAIARMKSLDGTGEEVKPGEGNVLKMADVSSITCKVYDIGTDKDATTGTEITPAPTVTVSTSVFDTLRTVGWPVDEDPHGYNFRFDISAAYTADPNEWRAFEFDFNLVAGGIAPLDIRVKTRPRIRS